MSKSRMINTRFWRDTYIDTLDPTEKLLFLYLLTNPETNITGIYELPQRLMSSDTGFDVSMLKKLFSRLEKDEKAYYIDGWVYLVNALKHQNTDNPKITGAISRELGDVPKEIMAKINAIHKSEGIPYIYPIDNLSHLTKPNLTKPNLTAPTKKPTASQNYLTNLPQGDVEEFIKKFVVTSEQVKSKAGDLKDWCEANGKKKKNYKAFLRVALKKDYGVREDKKVIEHKGKKYLVLKWQNQPWYFGGGKTILNKDFQLVDVTLSENKLKSLQAKYKELC